MNDESIVKPDTNRQQQLTALRWFVCKANPQRMLKSLRAALDHVGVEYYMAIGNTAVHRSQEIVEHETSLLGCYFFVRTNYLSALKLKSDYGFDYQYVRDGQKQLMWVRDSQMNDFRKLIAEMADKIDFNADIYAVGDPVIVTRGPLTGIRGILTGVEPKQLSLLLKVDGVLAISVRIAKSNVRKISREAMYSDI